MSAACLGKNKPAVVFSVFFFLLTTFALCSGVQVEDNIEGLSQLPGCGFALPVLTDRSDVNGLGVKTAVEELLRLQQDRKASLRVQHSRVKTEMGCQTYRGANDTFQLWVVPYRAIN